MTPERARYHQLMLTAGLYGEYERELDQVLETADPIPEPELTLAFCISDRNKTISVLYNYTLDHPADEKQVYDMVLSTIRDLYTREGHPASELTCILYRIAMAADRWCVDPPWCDVYDLSIDQELYADGHISEEVFLAVFEALLLHGQYLSAWELQQKEIISEHR